MAVVDKPKDSTELQKLIEQLVADNQQNPAFNNWPNDRFSLKPVLSGQQVQISVTQAGGASKDYQLWYHNGKLAMLTAEQAAEIYQKEVMDGVVKPIQLKTNPITGGPLERGYGSQNKWIAEDGTIPEKITLPAQKDGKDVEVKISDLRQYYVDYDPATKTAKVYDSWSQIDRSDGKQHMPQKWWATPSAVQDGLIKFEDRAGYGETLVAKGGVKHEFKKPYGYSDDRVTNLHEQAKKITAAYHQNLDGPPEKTIVATPDMIAKLPKGLVTNGPVPATIARAAPVASIPAPVEDEPKQGPPPLPPILANATQIQAAKLEDVVAKDYKSVLGKDISPASDKDGLAVPKFYEATYNLENSMMRAYFDAPANSPERKAALEDIKQQISSVPDGLKALAVLYVKESISRNAPADGNEYRRQASLMFEGKSAAAFVADKEKLLTPTREQPKAQLEAERPAAPAVSTASGTPRNAAGAGLPPDELKILLPRGKDVDGKFVPDPITNRSEYNAAYNGADAAAQKFKEAYWSATSHMPRLSEDQIKYIVDAHKKALPAIGAELEKMAADLKKLSPAERQNGPGDIHSNTIAGLSRVNDELKDDYQKQRQSRNRSENNADASASANPGTAAGLVSLPPQIQKMMEAKPGNAAGTAMAANIFLGFEARNPGMISPETAKATIATYTGVNKELGAMVQRIYDELQAAPNKEARQKILKEHQGKDGELGDLGRLMKEGAEERIREKGAKPQASAEPSFMDRVRGGVGNFIEGIKTPEPARAVVASGPGQIAAGGNIYINGQKMEQDANGVATGRPDPNSSKEPPVREYNEALATKYFTAGQCKEPGGCVEAFKGASQGGIRKDLGLDLNDGSTIVLNGPVRDKIEHNGNVVVNGGLDGGSVAATGNVSVQKMTI